MNWPPPLPRRIARSLAVLIVAATPLSAYAEPPGEADHDELRAMLVTLTKAINEGQFDTLEPILAEKFVFTTSDQASLTSLSEIKAHFEKTFGSAASPVTSLTIAPEATIETQFVDDNNGYCYGTATEIYTLKGGKQMQLTSSWTGTVTKVDGTWKISAAHVGIHFFDNPVTDLLKGSVKWTLITGIVIGLLAGFLLPKIIGLIRRKAAA